MTGNLPNRSISKLLVDRGNSKSVYAVLSGFGSGHVFHSTTGGTSWTDISGDLPDTPGDSIAIDPVLANTFYVATDTGAYVTTDGGTSWSILGQGLPNVVVQDLLMFEPARLLRVVTHGRGAWELSLPLTSSTTLTATPSKPSVGQPVSLKATVTGAAGLIPTGSVTFSADGIALASPPLNNSGVATYTASTNGISPGTHAVLAGYSGDSSYNSSTSPALNVTLAKAPTAVTLAALPTSVTPPADVTLTATVKRSANGATGTPTGSVTFYADGVALGTVKLSAEAATLTASSSGISAGSYSITAKYAGNASTPPPLPHL